MNLQTGVTEAKLLDSNDDESDKTSKHNALVAVDPEVVSDVDTEVQNEATIVQTAQHVDGVHVMSSEDGEQTLFANGKLTPQQLQEALKNFDFEDVEVATDEVKHTCATHSSST
jgi:capsule polysaccharide export protein KpsC/LpsZ